MRRLRRVAGTVLAGGLWMTAAAFPAHGQIIPLSVPSVGTPALFSPRQAPGAHVDKDGWWNRFQGPQEGEPPLPGRSALPRVPQPPTVPANAIAAGAEAGQQDKVAAVGVIIDAPAGSGAALLSLTLKEASTNGANLNAAQAIVVACPILEFWAGTANGDWVTRPKDDCGLGQAVGARTQVGTEFFWNFDLTSMASLWLSGRLSQNGVLLKVTPGSATGAFQVSWVNSGAGGIVVAFVPGTPPASPAAPPPPAGGSGQTGLTQSPSFSVAGEPAPPPAAAPAPDRVVLARPAGTQGERIGKADLSGGIGLPTVLLAVLMLVLGLMVATVLGPAGDPGAAMRREGSVSRTLARREKSLLGSKGVP